MRDKQAHEFVYIYNSVHQVSCMLGGMASSAAIECGDRKVGEWLSNRHQKKSGIVPGISLRRNSRVHASGRSCMSIDCAERLRRRRSVRCKASCKYVQKDACMIYRHSITSHMIDTSMMHSICVNTHVRGQQYMCAYRYTCMIVYIRMDVERSGHCHFGSSFVLIKGTQAHTHTSVSCIPLCPKHPKW